MLAVPVVEDRLISGDLNMSTVAMAQRQILREEKLTGQKLPKEKKAEIVESITRKTMAKAEIELFKLLPETASHPANFERRVSEHATRLNLTVPNDVMEMLIRLKELWAHVDPRMDHLEVIRRSLKMTLQKVDPAQKKSSVKKEQLKVREDVQTSMNAQRESTQSLTDSVKHRGTKRPTYYRKELDLALWERAESQCEFIDEKTGRRCSCRFRLQREHVIPLALGGLNELSNMQLLCATHNQLRARRIFGDKKIDSYQIKRRFEPSHSH
jgi:5-methylcytosine-specific restriction endonuclease McrA